MSDAQAAPPSFETALERLEHIVRTLEDGELPLDDALELFEEGIRLSRFCHGKLEQAERRVEILLRNQSGELETVTFSGDDEAESN
jgi:exodeoxyribonuclease VII small subunit